MFMVLCRRRRCIVSVYNVIHAVRGLLIIGLESSQDACVHCLSTLRSLTRIMGECEDLVIELVAVQARNLKGLLTLQDQLNELNRKLLEVQIRNTGVSFASSTRASFTCIPWLMLVAILVYSYYYMTYYKGSASVLRRPKLGTVCEYRCPICLEDRNGRPMRTPCNHLFDDLCLRMALRRNRRCPICRAATSF